MARLTPIIWFKHVTVSRYVQFRCFVSGSISFSCSLRSAGPTLTLSIQPITRWPCLLLFFLIIGYTYFASLLDDVQVCGTPVFMLMLYIDLFALFQLFYNFSLNYFSLRIGHKIDPLTINQGVLSLLKMVILTNIISAYSINGLRVWSRKLGLEL